MNTVSGAATSIVVLSAGGALPTIALTRARLVAIPLLPLTGALVAGLAVTAMTGLGGTVGDWFSILSILGAVTVLLWWWWRPTSRPWIREDGRTRAMLLCASGLGVGVIAGAFGLSALKANMPNIDARSIWLVHPAWYLAGHNTTVAALRDPALAFSHPPYPPLVGGAVAISWLVSGSHSDRLGVVILSVLNVSAVLAAACASIEVVRRLARCARDKRQRLVIGGGGVLATGLLMLVTFAVGQPNLVIGNADVLWSAAAVGAVAYGLVLPCENANVGAATLLAAIAGTTKLEGAATAVVIVGLVALRLLVQPRRAGEPRPWLLVCSVAFGSWFVIGIWPIVIRLFGALPDKLSYYSRQGTDVMRLHASAVSAWSELHIVALAAAVAVTGALTIRAARRRAGLGSDLWAWASLVAEVMIVIYVYTVGPGNVHDWLHASIQRTMLFPVLEAYWLMATWAMVAFSEIVLVRPSFRLSRSDVKRTTSSPESDPLPLVSSP